MIVASIQSSLDPTKVAGIDLFFLLHCQLWRLISACLGNEGNVYQVCKDDLKKENPSHFSDCISVSEYLLFIMYLTIIQRIMFCIDGRAIKVLFSPGNSCCQIYLIHLLPTLANFSSVSIYRPLNKPPPFCPETHPTLCPCGSHPPQTLCFPTIWTENLVFWLKRP